MAQLRMSDKLKQEIMTKLTQSKPTYPVLTIPDSLIYAFEMSLVPETIKEWVKACPDTKLLTEGRFNIGSIQTKIMPSGRVITHKCVHIPEEIIEYQLYTDRYASDRQYVTVDENSSDCPQAIRDYVAAIEKIEPKIAALEELIKSMQRALNYYVWANTFIKEIPQAKMYMPNWAINKIYVNKKPKLKNNLSNHIADEDLAGIKTALVKQALTG